MARSRDDSFNRARAIYDKRLSPQSTQQMRGLLETSVVEASALLATSVLCDYLNRWNKAGPAEVAEAETAVRQALAIDPNHALAHYANGFVHRTRGEHEAALAAFTQALRLRPEFARCHAQRGAELLYLGRPDEAIAEVDTAISLSPNNPSIGMFFWITGRARFYMGQYAEAVPWLQRSVRLWPKVWYNRLYLVSAYAHLGNKAAATRGLRAFDRLFPNYTVARVLVEEQANPIENPFVVAGRDRFHDGLHRAGMS